MRAHQPRPAPLKPQIYGLGVEQRVEALRQQTARAAGDLAFAHRHGGVYLPAAHQLRGRPSPRGGERACWQPGVGVVRDEHEPQRCPMRVLQHKGAVRCARVRLALKHGRCGAALPLQRTAAGA